MEVWGGLGTQASHDRSNGFHAVTDKEQGIQYLLDQQSADWKQAKAYDIMATALRNHEDITLVYGHNDPMAYGAYLAAKDVAREKASCSSASTPCPTKVCAGSTTASLPPHSSIPHPVLKACGRH